MNFYLSERSPLHSTFSTEDGQVIYKVETPMKLYGRTSTITRVIPNDVKRDKDVDMRDRFEYLAQIEHNVIASSIIRFEGRELKTKEYFRKDGWSGLGRHRAFTGPDGKEYKWLLGMLVPELILNDGSKTPIAQFHRKSLGIIGSARPARLEIFPQGRHMTDLIVVTFIYIEKLRKDKEDAASHSGGGGGP